MNEIQRLIQEMCPDGVPIKPLWSLTAWDKKFNAVDKSMQKKIIKYPYLLAKDLFALQTPKGNVKLLSTGTQEGWTTEERAGEFLCEGEIVSIPWGKSEGAKNPIKYYKGKFVTADNRIATSLDTNVLNNKYLYYWLISNSDSIDKLYRGASILHPEMNAVLNIQIPLPPLPIQQRIVETLDKFTSLVSSLDSEIDLRQKQYEYYRNKLLTFEEGNQMIALGELFVLKNGYTPSKNEPLFWDDGTIPWFRMEDLRENGRILNDSMLHITSLGVKKSGLFPANSLIVATSATIGEHALITVDFLCNQRFTCLAPKSKYKNEIDMKFYFYVLFGVDDWCKNHVNQGGFASVDMSGFASLEIPIPSLETQHSIVRTLDTFESLLTNLKKERALRQKQYEYYREKLLTFA